MRRARWGLSRYVEWEVSRVDMDALSRESRAIREDAGAPLGELGVLDQLARYGEVELTGSYRWDTMLDPDIDLYVVNPEADLELALEAHVALIRRGDFYAHYFGDWVNFGHDALPTGHYIGLKRVFNGRKWKVDIWFLRASNTGSDWIAETMTEEGRPAILAFKHLKRMMRLDVSSYCIYRMVLLEGVTDTESFLEIARSRTAT